MFYLRIIFVFKKDLTKLLSSFEAAHIVLKILITPNLDKTVYSEEVRGVYSPSAKELIGLFFLKMIGLIISTLREQAKNIFQNDASEVIKEEEPGTFLYPFNSNAHFFCCCKKYPKKRKKQ